MVDEAGRLKLKKDASSAAAVGRLVFWWVPFKDKNPNANHPQTDGGMGPNPRRNVSLTGQRSDQLSVQKTIVHRCDFRMTLQRKLIPPEKAKLKESTIRGSCEQTGCKKRCEKLIVSVIHAIMETS